MVLRAWKPPPGFTFRPVLEFCRKTPGFVAMRPDEPCRPPQQRPGSRLKALGYAPRITAKNIGPCSAKQGGGGMEQLQPAGAFERLRPSGIRFTLDPLDAGRVRLAVWDDSCGRLIQLRQMQDGQRSQHSPARWRRSDAISCRRETAPTAYVASRTGM